MRLGSTCDKLLRRLAIKRGRREVVVNAPFLYRCANLLYELAERVDRDQRQLTPEFVARVAEASGFSADEVRSLGEVLKLLSLMMQALVVSRDSTIDQLTKRIFEEEKAKGGGTDGR